MSWSQNQWRLNFYIGWLRNETVWPHSPRMSKRIWFPNQMTLNLLQANIHTNSKACNKDLPNTKKKFVCKTTNFQLTLQLYRHESSIKTTYIHTRLQYITTEVDTSMIWTCWFITCTIIRQSKSCTEGEFPRRPLTRHLLVNMHISLGDIYISIIIRWANDLHGHLILKYMFNIPWEVSAKRKVTIKTSFTLTGKNVHVLPFMTTTALLASHLGHKEGGKSTIVHLFAHNQWVSVVKKTKYVVYHVEPMWLVN